MNNYICFGLSLINHILWWSATHITEMLEIPLKPYMDLDL